VLLTELKTDIRNEVTAAGGFATDSQVLGLASARNKTLIQNYNNLLATKTDAETQVNTMMGLEEKDQSNALSSITNKLNIDQQLSSYADKFIANAKEGFTTIISSVGISGLYNSLVNSDKTGNNLAYAAQVLGMTPDEMKGAAAQDYKTRTAQENLTKSQTDIAKTEAETAALNLKTAQNSGQPNPAFANQPGYNAQGIKYTPSSAQKEITDSWTKQKAFDPKTGKIPPAFYNQEKAWWVETKFISFRF